MICCVMGPLDLSLSCSRYLKKDAFSLRLQPPPAVACPPPAAIACHACLLPISAPALRRFFQPRNTLNLADLHHYKILYIIW